MNKPQGYVTSTDDPSNLTVCSLLPEEFIRQKVVPAGRLDKDTEGLLVFSNDGDFIHKLISPKNCIPKTYYIQYEGNLADNASQMVEKGLLLKDGTVCRCADLNLIGCNECVLTISEGQYHQVKRMIAALGGHVTFLRRIRIGQLEIGSLKSGETRELSEAEAENLLLFS